MHAQAVELNAAVVAGRADLPLQRRIAAERAVKDVGRPAELEILGIERGAYAAAPVAQFQALPLKVGHLPRAVKLERSQRVRQRWRARGPQIEAQRSCNARCECASPGEFLQRPAVAFDAEPSLAGPPGHRRVDGEPGLAPLKRRVAEFESVRVVVNLRFETIETLSEENRGVDDNIALRNGLGLCAGQGGIHGEQALDRKGETAR